MSKINITDNDLHAYVDGQLEASRRAEVEAHLAANEVAAKAVREYRRLNRRLHEEFDDVLNEPVPHAMLRVSRPQMIDTFRRIAAVLVLLVAGAAGGWLLNDVVAEGDDPLAAAFPERAGVIHAIYSAERRHAVEVPAGERPHLVAWLTNRLGTEVNIPDLTEAGFQLMGGRLLPGETKPAAHFLYEDVEGRRVTLYMRHGDIGGRNTKFTYAAEGSVGVFYWINGPAGYALAGSIEREELLKVAKLVYQQLGY
ncbi:MAG: anti-sigma factor [Alphaproteobacteria bacterium]